MALNRETIIAQLEIAFGEEVATQLYYELNSDTKDVMPNTGIFSRKSVHQAIISLIECVTKIKPNKEVAAYWNEVYVEFVKFVPSNDVIVAAVSERKRPVALTPEQRALAIIEKENKAKEAAARSAAAVAKYSASTETATSEEIEAAVENDIPF